MTVAIGRRRSDYAALHGRETGGALWCLEWAAGRVSGGFRMRIPAREPAADSGATKETCLTFRACGAFMAVGVGIAPIAESSSRRKIFDDSATG